MIPASEKAKLEEMSSIRCTGTVQGGFDPDCYKCRDFMAGAQAAWDLCEKYERARILEMINHFNWPDGRKILAETILTPPQSDEGASDE